MSDTPRLVRTRLRLPAPSPVRARLSGDHPAVHKGRSSDFDDIRDYQPGDDVRDIDWNVTARQGTMVIRRHVAEHVQRLAIVVDTGTAMRARAHSGEPKPAVVAAAVAVLGSAALTSGDLVALVAGDAGSVEQLPLRRGRRHTERLLRRLGARLGRPGAASDLAALLDCVRRQTRRHLVVVITDEAPLTATVIHAVRRLRTANDVAWITVADAVLVDDELDGDDLVDIDDGALLPPGLRLDPELRADFAAQQLASRTERRRALRAMHVANVELAASAAAPAVIARLFDEVRRA